MTFSKTSKAEKLPQKTPKQKIQSHIKSPQIKKVQKSNNS